MSVPRIIKPPLATFLVMLTGAVVLALLFTFFYHQVLPKSDRFTWKPRPGMECAVIKFDGDTAQDCYKVKL